MREAFGKPELSVGDRKPAGKFQAAQGHARVAQSGVAADDAAEFVALHQVVAPAVGRVSRAAVTGENASVGSDSHGREAAEPLAAGLRQERRGAAGRRVDRRKSFRGGGQHAAVGMT